MDDLKNLKVGDTFVEDLNYCRLTYRVIGHDMYGNVNSELISRVAICKDTDVQTIIEDIKAVQPKPEPKPVAKTAPKKAPAKKPTSKKK